MKIIKVVSIVVIVISVIALGIYAGKQMFRILEEKSQTPAPSHQPGTDKSPQNISIPNPGIASTLAAAENVASPDIDKTFPTTSSASQLSATGQTTGTAGASASAAGAAIAGKPIIENEVAYVLPKSAKVRDNPSMDAKEMMRVNQGTKGFVLEHKEGWTKIKWDFNKKIGWTRDDLLLIGPQEVLSTIVDNNGKLINENGIASATPSAIASMTTARVQAAKSKAQTIAQTVSSAVAKPAAPADTVKGYVRGAKLPEEGKIITDPAKVRAGPDTRERLVGKVQKGLTVKILSAKQVGKYMWFNISFNNGKKEGWTREDNIEF